MAGDVPTPAPVDPAGPGAPSVRLALYRRYRPATFAELKGQEHVTEPLRQALRTGRINHAYLFSGPRGCGKTSSARILARSLNCEQGPTPDPCGVCASCVALAPSGPGSIDVIEIDAASHGGVDDARDLRERAFYAPVSGRFKIYIIDEAHMVTREGFNALLKLVEEPPPHLKFVFATTEPEKVIATIRSRTHHYPFRLVPPAVLRDLLEEILASEGASYEPAVLPVVIRAGAGSARDSLSILDQLLAGSGDEGLTYERAIMLLGYTDDSLLDEVTDAFATGDGGAVFRAVDHVVEAGHDPRRFAADLLDRVRDLIILAAVPDAGETGLLDIPADRLDRMQEQAGKFGQGQLTRAAEVISTALVEMRGATSPRLLLELMCAQVLLPAAAVGEQAMLARLETLERRLAGGVGAAVARAAADAGTQAPGSTASAASTAGAAGSAGAAAASPPAPRAGGSAAGSGAAGASASSGNSAAGSGAAGNGTVGDGAAGDSAAGVGQAPATAAGSGRSAAAAAARAAAAAPRGTTPAASARGTGGSSGTGGSGASGGSGVAGRAGTAPAAEPAPAAAAPAGGADAGVLRDRWADVLEAVKQQRKVAWILLEKATVESLSDGALTLNFTNEGYAKGFASSGYDADLGRVLKAMFGISPQIRGTTGGTGAGQAGSGGQGSGYGGQGGGGQSGAGFGGPVGPSSPSSPAGPSSPATSGVASQAASGGSSSGGSPGPAAAAASAQPARLAPAQPPVPKIADEEFIGDYEDYEDYEAEDSPGGRPGGALAGSVEPPSSMALIERELGGKIIE
jgi:DNA polymerase-3 subunit gamma/tau